MGNEPIGEGFEAVLLRCRKDGIDGLPRQPKSRDRNKCGTGENGAPGYPAGLNFVAHRLEFIAQGSTTR
jgi:hypothetical protein